MINKDFIPYKQALALKELGFDEPCLGYWRSENVPNPLTLGKYTTKEDLEYELSGQDEHHNFKNIIALAPTFSQVFRWFEEKHQLFIQRAVVTTPNEILDIIYQVKSWKLTPKTVIFEFPTDCFNKSKADLECLKKLIEIVKNK